MFKFLHPRTPAIAPGNPGFDQAAWDAEGRRAHIGFIIFAIVAVFLTAFLFAQSMKPEISYDVNGGMGWDFMTWVRSILHISI